MIKVWYALIVFSVLVLLWMLWGNKALETNRYAIKCEKESFCGFKIAHLSDIHNSSLCKQNGKALASLSEIKPDIIVITGDTLDSYNTKIDRAVLFIEKALEIAPCYFVSGNHESRIPEYDEFKQKIISLGARVLENEGVVLKRGGEEITLFGVSDPSFKTDYLTGDSAGVMKESLSPLKDSKREYTVLLSHRPELFEIYAEHGIDLALCGHAHGGQARLPFIGGVIAPCQGFFPKYDSGIYEKGNTKMLISRGIGNSAFPLRFNNRPEICLIEFKK